MKRHVYVTTCRKAKRSPPSNKRGRYFVKKRKKKKVSSHSQTSQLPRFSIQCMRATSILFYFCTRQQPCYSSTLATTLSGTLGYLVYLLPHHTVLPRPRHHPFSFILAVHHICHIILAYLGTISVIT